MQYWFLSFFGSKSMSVTNQANRATKIYKYHTKIYFQFLSYLIWFKGKSSPVTKGVYPTSGTN